MYKISRPFGIFPCLNAFDFGLVNIVKLVKDSNLITGGHMNMRFQMLKVLVIFFARAFTVGTPGRIVLSPRAWRRTRRVSVSKGCATHS